MIRNLMCAAAAMAVMFAPADDRGGAAVAGSIGKVGQFYDVVDGMGCVHHTNTDMEAAQGVCDSLNLTYAQKTAPEALQNQKFYVTSREVVHGPDDCEFETIEDFNAAAVKAAKADKPPIAKR